MESIQCGHVIDHPQRLAYPVESRYLRSRFMPGSGVEHTTLLESAEPPGSVQMLD